MNRVVLVQWLDRPEHLPAQLETMRHCFKAHIDYLARKHEFGLNPLSMADLLPEGAGGAAGLGVSDSAARKAAADLLARLGKSVEEDSAKLAQCAQSLELLERLAGQTGEQGGADHADQLAVLRHRFVCLQTGRDSNALPVPSPDEARRAFARFVMDEAPSHFATVRGTLLATEMLAARVRARARVRFF
ncbi:MAG: hypothetical protein HYZ18_00075 [Pseudogulbenkiania sp.]|nr:hypothetical protein [Pseudogulbenkiania sp.]